MRLLPLTLLVSLAACQEAADTRTPAAAAAAPSRPVEAKAQPAAAVSDLAGTWTIASIDDASAPEGLALVGNADTLWWEPRCAGMARRYRITGSVISFGSVNEPVPAGSPTAPVCAIGLPPRLRDVFQVLDGASSVAKTPAGHLALEGTGGRMTLVRR
jgi:hypothetical protein